MITWSRHLGNLTRLGLWVTRLGWPKGEQKTKSRGLQLKVGPETPRQTSRKIYMSLRLKAEGFCNSTVSLTSSTIRFDKTWARMTKARHNRLHCQRLFIALGSRESVFVFFLPKKVEKYLTNQIDKWRPVTRPNSLSTVTLKGLKDRAGCKNPANSWFKAISGQRELENLTGCCLMEKCNHCNYLTPQVGLWGDTWKFTLNKCNQCSDPAVDPS